MPEAFTIDQPDILALIEKAADRLTGGDKMEAVALALRRLLEREERTGSLFRRQRGSVQVAEGVDLITVSCFDEPTDAETGKELEHGRKA